MLIPFRLLLRSALRDRISLGYAIVFPVVALVGLGMAFPTAGYRQVLLIGMIALSTLFFSLNGGAHEALYQRNSGLYKLLRVTPYRTVFFLASLAAARGTVALLSSAVVAITGMVIFGIQLHWQHIALLVPVLLLGTVCFTLVGLFVSNLAQNAGQVAMLTNLVTIPMIFGTATFYSLAGAPTWVKLLEPWLPLSHLIDGVRFAMMGDLPSIIQSMLWLGGCTILVLGLAVFTFRWDVDQPLFGNVATDVRALPGRMFPHLAPIPAISSRPSFLGKEREKNQIGVTRGERMTEQLDAVIQAAKRLSPAEQDRLAHHIATWLPDVSSPTRFAEADGSDIADVSDHAANRRDQQISEELATPAYEEL